MTGVSGKGTAAHSNGPMRKCGERRQRASQSWIGDVKLGLASDSIQPPITAENGDASSPCRASSIRPENTEQQHHDEMDIPSSHWTCTDSSSKSIKRPALPPQFSPLVPLPPSFSWGWASEPPLPLSPRLNASSTSSWIGTSDFVIVPSLSAILSPQPHVSPTPFS